jgi:hypothetical protein
MGGLRIRGDEGNGGEERMARPEITFQIGKVLE